MREGDAGAAREQRTPSDSATWRPGRIVAVLALVVAACGIACFGGAVFAPWLLTNVFALGRLQRSIAVGDAKADVIARVERFCRDHAESPELECSRGAGNAGFAALGRCEDGTLPVDHVHVYDWYFMDDVQLWVFFDAEGRACRKVFWAD